MSDRTRGHRPRIDALAELVPEGCRVADVGTDRALLPRRLLAAGRVSRCIASERDASRVERARRAAATLRDDPRFELRAGDGLAVLHASDRIEVAVIAGLGGGSIRAILTRVHPSALGIRRLVLQPQTDIASVRAWLATHGFRIVDERLVLEGRRFFTILAAESGRSPAPASVRGLSAEDVFEVGPVLAASGDPVVREAWIRELERVQAILSVAAEGRGRGRAEALRRRNLAQRILAALPEPDSAGS